MFAIVIVNEESQRTVNYPQLHLAEWLPNYTYKQNNTQQP